MKSVLRFDVAALHRIAVLLSFGTILTITALGESSCASSPGPKDMPCEGEACSDVRIWYDGCYQAVNHGHQQVVINMSPWMTVLSPGEQFTLVDPSNKEAGCAKNYLGAATAKY
jgi:hypothetical protein